MSASVTMVTILKMDHSANVSQFVNQIANMENALHPTNANATKILNLKKNRSAIASRSANRYAKMRIVLRRMCAYVTRAMKNSKIKIHQIFAVLFAIQAKAVQIAAVAPPAFANALKALDWTRQIITVRRRKNF